ncbi:MAG TPA: GspMb/PilO family protein [Verrucomicrobiae bacterium]|nr:GspMb/PilO family protein [Verrucomicrobiae bacterium]
MNIIPKDKEKRTQFILVILGTLMVLGLIGFLLIRPQYQTLSGIHSTADDERAKLQKIKDTIKKAGDTSLQLSNVTANLSRAEEDMATGDNYAWTYDTVRKFKASYRVDIPTIGQPSLADVDVLPQFPFKQIRVTVSGTAYYHELGRFIADLENSFPHIRVVNLTVEPVNPADPGNEKLSFRMDIIALVKPNS